VSNEGDRKPVDVDAMIEAKRQRMAGGSPAQEAAAAKAAQAAAESARRAAEVQATKPKGKEEIYDRLAREAIFKKQSASLLAQVTLVSADEEETDDELMPTRPKVTGPAGSSKRKRRSGTARHRRSGSRRSGSRSRLKGGGGGSGGGGDGSLGVVMAILGILLVLGLVFLIL
jgi:hypothetical protein